MCALVSAVARPGGDRAVDILVDICSVWLRSKILVRYHGVHGHVDCGAPDRVVVCTKGCGTAGIERANGGRTAQDHNVLAEEGAGVDVERDFCLALGLEVCWEARNGSWRSKAHGWWPWRVASGRCFCLWVQARVVAEVAGFVHVDPESVNVNTGFRAEEAAKLAVPVRLCTWSEPIRESCHTRPDDTFVRGAVRELEESVMVNTVVEARVVLVRNRWVDHHHCNP